MKYSSCFFYFSSSLAIAASCVAPTRELPPGKTELNGGCTYNTTFLIGKSSTELNCNGAVLDGAEKFSSAIVVDSGGVGISNIKIKNCKIQNYKKTGISIGWNIPDGKKKEMVRQVYGTSPFDVHVQNVDIKNIGSVGIYIDDYSKNVKIEGCSVSNVVGAGVYIEHDSEGTTVVNSSFNGNGWNAKGHGTQPGIAIDSSIGNRIIGNSFSGNGLAAISMYRNCDEDAENPNSVKRILGADNNLIDNNKFYNQSIAVWVASRMSRDVSLMKCGRAPYLVEGRRVYVEDQSINNRISNNYFFGPGVVAVKVEMGPNIIEKNKFSNSAYKRNIEVGSATYFRAKRIKSNNVVIDQPGISVLNLD